MHILDISTEVTSSPPRQPTPVEVIIPKMGELLRIFFLPSIEQHKFLYGFVPPDKSRTRQIFGTTPVDSRQIDMLLLPARVHHTFQLRLRDP